MIAIKLLVALVVCQAAALIGSLFTTPSLNNWYLYINKPFFTPPGWLIGSVWAVLYVLMGVALFIIWINNNKFKKVVAATLVFAVQLALNILWSIIFFGLHSIGGALVCIVALWIAILYTIIKFNKISELAGLLMIPYLLWVSFASVLNLAIFFMNQ
jgi:tryptophan-rich sensory protein